MRSDRRLTLHEAMVLVLRSRGGGWMERDELAREIARRDLYRQRAGGAPPSDQLRLRAKKYPHIFECRDSRCTKIRLVPEAPGSIGPVSGRVVTAPSTDQAVRPTPPVPTSQGLPDRHSERTLAWHEGLRRAYRPTRLRVLLVAESPPDPEGGERRFFYSPELTRHDNLYRGVAEALYGNSASFDLRDKPAVLKRLQDEGLWMIDAVEQPVNHLAPRERAQAIGQAVPALVERCRALAPEQGVIICHSKVYEAVAPALRAAGTRILHEEPLPFPLPYWRARFVAAFRRAMAEA